jgi:hypothetical protein
VLGLGGVAKGVVPSHSRGDIVLFEIFEEFVVFDAETNGVEIRRPENWILVLRAPRQSPTMLSKDRTVSESSDVHS